MMRKMGWRRAITVAVLAGSVLMLSVATAASAQDLRGTVVRGGRGVPGARITLHRVTREASGAVGRTVTAPDGSFRIAVPAAPDTAGGDFSVFFATAELEGARYFGPALHAGDKRDGYRIVAFDTTSSHAAADSVRVTRRDLALVAEQQGGWEVGEVVRLENRSTRTIVPAAGKPVVSVPVPAGITSFDVGGGDLSANEVIRVGDAVGITGALVPGRRDLYIRYLILKGPRQLEIPTGRGADSLNIFIQQPAPGARVEGLGAARPFTTQGERYLRYSGANLLPSSRVLLRWPGPATPPVDARWAAAAAAALVLVGALVAARVRRRGGGPPPPTSSTPAPRPPRALAGVE